MSEDTPEYQPTKIRRKWLTALQIADKAERDWRDQCARIVELYRGSKKKKNSFNILFSNTDTMAPAILNSTPKPDVRRRWNDDDPLGKAVSDVLNRSLAFCMDDGAFMETLTLNLYDYLLTGRAICRIRYIPSFNEYSEEQEPPEQEQQEPDAESYEELAWEQVTIEHVQYDDFRRGPGRSWSEVCWIAFKHRLSKDEIAERFGEDKADKMAYDEVDDSETGTRKQDDDKIKGGTAEIWEFWDKDDKKVYFIAKGYGEGLLSEMDDPLQLKGFFPIPAPIYAFQDSTNLIPVPLYQTYQNQAEELERISFRINRLVDALKVRGIYDSTISELSQLFTGDDNQLFPAENISIIMDRGGLDKAVWMLDIQPIVSIIAELYTQREQCKQVIYEIIGLSDILRGSSDANETATAQNIKAQWGGNRIGRMQRAFQYYIRDIVRLMAEVIGQQFQIDTLKGMTGLKFPTNAEVQQQMMQYQTMAQQAQMQGQQPPPPPEPPITWEQIAAVLRDDMQREYKVDIETDSTLAASQQADMQGLRDLLGGLAQMMQSFAPIVQAGAMPVEAVKELTLAVVRRAKLGNAVEDAFEKIQQPPPPQPEQQPQDNSLQVAQINAQVEQAKAQQQAQLDNIQLQQTQVIEQEKLQSQERIEQAKLVNEAHMEQLRMQHEKELKMLELQTQFEIERYKVDHQPEPEEVKND